jgi:hypothetical protein
MYRNNKILADQLCLIELPSQHPGAVQQPTIAIAIIAAAPIYKSLLVPLLAVAEEMQQRRVE